ncbi:MAG: cyanoexosortase A [Prochlorotrichaceae cyanobacterium]
MRVVSQNYRKVPFWLAVLTIAVFTFLWRWDFNVFQSDRLAFSVAIGIHLWQRRSVLQLDSSPTDTGLGILLLLWTLIRSMVRPVEGDIFTTFAPLVAGVALALIASGVRGIQQYWRELLCAFLAVIPITILFRLPNISILDAQITHVLLWNVGFDATRQGTIVLLPGGGIDIYPGCSSLGLIFLLLKLLIAFRLLVPLSWGQMLRLMGISTAIAVGLNGIRLCLLAVVISNQNQAAFDYWHHDGGPEVFVSIAVVLFGLVLYREMSQFQEQQS